MVKYINKIIHNNNQSILQTNKTYIILTYTTQRANKIYTIVHI